MSEELEWELVDIFESGLFAFPIWDHHAARRIIHYLLLRGILREEIADAIEDSDSDLDCWLNRGGRHMVGEWVIAWINETREDYYKEKAIAQALALQNPILLREVTPSIATTTETGGDNDDFGSHTDIKAFFLFDEKGTPPNELQSDDETLAKETDMEIRSSDDDVDSPVSQSASPPPLPPRIIHSKSLSEIRKHHALNIKSKSFSELRQLEMRIQEAEDIANGYSVPKRLEGSCDRSTGDQEEHIYDSVPNIYESTEDLESDENMKQNITNDSSTQIQEVALIHATDDTSSDVYYSIPADNVEDNNDEMNTVNNNDKNIVNNNEKNSITESDMDIITERTKTDENSQSDNNQDCEESESTIEEKSESITDNVNDGDIPDDRIIALLDHGDDSSSSEEMKSIHSSSLPICPNCTCKLYHYSYKPVVVPRPPSNNDNYCLFFTNPDGRAMEFHYETIDRDGPGFIFIMTDCLQECLPWSADSRYKVASSRLPERCLMEFRSRAIEIELIWKVRVPHHIQAVKEVHVNLSKFNLHTNWYKCPLSIIVETVSRVAKRYRSTNK